MFLVSLDCHTLTYTFCSSAMPRPKLPFLLDLNDALLDRILQHLVESSGVRGAVKTACLINKRFAALVKQPLAAWACITPHVFGQELRVRDALANLAQWLVGVAPALRSLRLPVHIDELGRTPPCRLVDAATFLPRMTNLQGLQLSGVHLMADELAFVGALTALTLLGCQCFLGDGTAPLSSLASLQELRELTLTFHTSAAPGEQLPASLSALSRLEQLEISARDTSEYGSSHVRLPWAWCQAATQLSRAQLGVDLPLLVGDADRNRPIFPALTELQLSSPVDPLSSSALACCQALRELSLEHTTLRDADWAALAALTHLAELVVKHCSYEEDEEELAQPQALSTLTALTYLKLRDSAIPPAITQLPALRSLHVNNYDMRGEGVGWPLPPGPWLQRLEDLTLEGDMGSMETALRQATELTCLWLDGCPWLRFGRDELPLLLALPLRELSIDKRIEWDEEIKYAPRPLWDGDSLWVVEGLRYVLGVRAARGEPVTCNICTKTSF